MSIFKFKQFEVDQRGSPMRINTDGVLLGAMVEYPKPKYILDIGTGTGVIALMLAQKYEEAKLDAVEIDEEAYLVAVKNFANSKFTGRLQAYHTSFEHLEPKGPYELIVSNPPFFLNALKNPDIRKSNARHASSTFYHTLLQFAEKWLEREGILQLILPVELSNYLIELAINRFQFFHVSSIFIRSFEDSEPFRQLFTLSKQRQDKRIEWFTIYQSKGVYTDAYRNLLKPYFLNF